MLLTSAPAIGAQRRGERLVPAAPLAVLFTHTLLPALLTLIAIRRRRAGVPISAPSMPVVFNGSGGRVSFGAFGSCGAVAASVAGEAGAGAGAEAGEAGAGAGAEAGAADTGAGAAGSLSIEAIEAIQHACAHHGTRSLSIEAIEAIREALFASDIELADGMSRWREVEVEAFFESGGDMGVVHRMREAAPATMEALTTAPATMGALTTAPATMEALATAPATMGALATAPATMGALTTAPATMGAQGSVAALSPRALRGTQRHSGSLRGTQRHSEALSPRASAQAVVATAHPQGQGQGAESAPPLPMSWPADEAARDCLRAVLVRVGGESRSEPSAAACAVMRLLSSGLPQLRWTVIDMVRGADCL